MLITGLYAGILALIQLFLHMKVSDARMKLGISVLHGENLELADKIRRHANFVESVPFALLLIGIVELNQARPVVLHALGATLVAARIMHPFGLRHDVMPHPLRAAGAGLTFLVTLVAAGMTIWHFATHT
jgi:uncharacterized membrane protein YecN with MAPEG domain